MSRRSGIVAISLSYVRMASLAVEGGRQVRKDETPGDLRLPGFASCRQAAALRRMVEEHSGGERGLVHLAHAGEEVVSDFHDGCHYPARAIAPQAVVSFSGTRCRAVTTHVDAPAGVSSQRGAHDGELRTTGFVGLQDRPCARTREGASRAPARAYAGAAPCGIADAPASTVVSWRSYVPISNPLAIARASSSVSSVSRPGESGGGASPPRANTWNA